ncbi:MAG: hypothetical protein JXA11_04700 [Phycisphaerae bacterium]|nr:hypothetical protein [Phycisphaerae bacterium]
MTGKKIALLISAGVLAMVILAVSDKMLRAKSGWVGRDRKKSDTAQPFLANWVFPTRYQTRLQAQEIVDRADQEDSQDRRASLLLQAADMLKDKDDSERRMHYLMRVCEECPDTPRTADAWVQRMQMNLAEKPTQSPSQAVEELLRLMKQFGVGNKQVSSKLIQDTIKSLEKSYPDEAKKLQSALDAATPKKK